MEGTELVYFCKINLINIVRNTMESGTLPPPDQEQLTGGLSITEKLTANVHNEEF